MKISFQFGKAFSAARKNYQELDEDSRGVLNAYLLVLLVLFVLILLLSKSEVPWVEGVQTLLLGIWIALSFAVFDRLNLLSPIQKQIEDRLRGLDQAVEQLNLASAKLDGYSKYTRSRLGFGLNDVVGLRNIGREDASGRSVFESTHLIETVLADAKKGDEIRYMTTYVKDYAKFLAAVRQALNNEVSIKLLLMMPCIDTPIVEARHMDFDQDQNGDLDLFVEAIRVSAAHVLRVRDLMQAQGKPFEVYFYSKALHFPLIVRTTRSEGMISEEVAYTGFYVRENAERMPYLEWRGGDFRITEYFKSVFDTKWQAVKSKQMSEIDCGAAAAAPTPAAPAPETAPPLPAMQPPGPTAPIAS